MKDTHGNEFTQATVHCWNCKHYQDYENSAFSWCKKNKSCLSMFQLKTLNPVTCIKFENRYEEKKDETRR